MLTSQNLLQCRRCGHSDLRLYDKSVSEKAFLAYIKCNHCDHELMGFGSTYEEAQIKVVEVWNADGMNEYE